MNVYEIVTDKIIKQLEAGVAPWSKPWKTSGGNWPKNLVFKKHYNGVNVFLLLCGGADYSSSYWLTYKQALSLGGNVKKGEKSTMITFWMPTNTTKKNKETGEDETKRGMILRYYNVFNLNQCEGIADPDADMAPVAPVNKIEAAEAIIANMPNVPKIKKSANTWYRPSTDEVGIPAIQEFVEPEAYYSTLFHELTHSTGHASRIGRDDVKTMSTKFGSEDYSKEELIAELGAAMLCGTIGIERRLNESAAYLQSWIEKLRGDSRLIISAASQAQKAADYILGKSAKAVEESKESEELVNV